MSGLEELLRNNLQLIVGIAAFGMSLYFFYQVLTYESRPPAKWGFTKGAKPRSKFTAFVFALAWFVGSILLIYEKPPLLVSVIFILMCFVNFGAMIYDLMRSPSGRNDCERQ